MNTLRLRWTGLAATLALAGCTPPRTELRPSDKRDADVRVLEHRTGSGNMGMAAAPMGSAFFGTDDELYRALADIVTGTVARGASSYSLDLSEQRVDDPERERLQRVAERSARASARAEGKRLLAAQIDIERGDERSPRVRVTSNVLDPNGSTHQELREGVIVNGHVAWTTPPLRVSSPPAVER